MSSLSIPSVLPGALTTLEPQIRAGAMIAQQFIGIRNIPLDGNVVMFSRGDSFLDRPYDCR